MAIVAIDGDDRVALVRQWRLPADAALLEIPAGGLDVGDDGTKEDPEVAARRELEEETGMRARTWQKLAEFYSAPGFTDELMHLFLATDLEPASQDGRLGPDEDERLILEWRPWTEAVAAVGRGEIRDAKSIVGLLWLERLRRRADPGSSASFVAPGVETAGSEASATSAIQVAYGLTIGEAVRATVGLTRRSSAIRVLGLLTIAVGALAAFAGDLLSIIGVVIGLALVTGWVAAPLAWWQFRGRPDLGGAETTLTLDEVGTDFDSPFMHGGEPWSSYRRVHDIGGCFLFDNAAGGIAVVPKRAFSPAQLGDVYRLLDRHGLSPVRSVRSNG